VSFKLIQGDALAVLRTMPEESVNCCVCSPPYWGLRDYKLEPLVWGGTKGGEHAWGNEQIARGPAQEQGATSQRQGRTNTDEQKHRGVSQGCWCQLCGAWRGSLGLEPTPALYVSHLVEIFTEVRRVLRKDGTLWLNLGDTFATGGGKVGDCPGGGEQGERWRGYRGTRPESPKNSAGALWAGQHPGRMKQGGLDTNSGAAMGPMTQPNRLPIPGLKSKDLVGIPWMTAFALRDDGWWLRSDIVWCKANGMPESVKDRPTRAHEFIFLLTKSPKYYYNSDAVAEPVKLDTPARYQRGRSEDHKYADGGPGEQTIARSLEHMKQDGHGRRHAGFNEREFAGKPRETRNLRSWWLVNTLPTPEAHFATFPITLAERMVLAGCPEGGVVLDPFAGAGTTGLACLKHGRKFIGIELSAEYVKIAQARAEKHMSLLVAGGG
jgi:DNA modification methylase